MTHITSYGFADGNGDSITRGLQLTEEQAYDFAQEQANARGVTVEFWVEGDSSDNGEPCGTLVSVEPEGNRPMPDANKIEWQKMAQAASLFHVLTDFIEQPDETDIERWKLAAIRWTKRAAAAERAHDNGDDSNAVLELDAAAAIESDWCVLTEKTQAFADSIYVEWSPKETL